MALVLGTGLLPPGQFPGISLAGLLVSVVVGRQGWYPAPIETLGLAGPQWSYATSCHGAPRLWWTGTALQPDGWFDVNQQKAIDDAFGVRTY